ncbi:MAG: hypothetical protein DRQ47_09300 [Gammaproteobacteria bacterium]|nr:MAG: hypothetical protein DRQ47_09300 [Gammaproteobacteria bacterium]
MINHWSDILGLLGSILIIIGYLLLQMEKISSKKFIYSFINGLGALLIIVSLYFNFNLSAFVIEFFWLLISIFGLYKWARQQKLGDL